MNISSNEWQHQEAKNKLSKLVKDAGKGIPNIEIRPQQFVPKLALLWTY